MSHYPVDDFRTSEEICLEVARNDPWLAEVMAKIVATDFEALLERSVEPAPLLQTTLVRAKELHKSVCTMAATSEKQRQAAKTLCNLGRDSVRLTVSRSGIDRALRLINFIICQCETYGIKATMNDKRYIVVAKGLAAIRLSFNERFEKVYVPPVENGGRNKRPVGSYISQGTGELSITIYGCGSTRRIPDKFDLPLEAQYNRILSKIALAVAETDGWFQYLNGRMEKSKAAAFAEAAEAARQAQLTAQAEAHNAAHLKRKTDLYAEAAAFNQATVIRNYVAHVEKQSKTQGNLDLNLPSWLKWAAAMADDLDPTVRRLHSHTMQD